jgi:hypothetical protein
MKLIATLALAAILGGATLAFAKTPVEIETDNARAIVFLQKLTSMVVS